jgi:hypothetical protein|tara:strand:+ start:1186 stop:1734 length:549 start_codon:yes stop_codon:yes gene_type:complete
MKTKKLFSVFRNVFGNWRYIALTIIIALVFYSINVFITNFSSIISYYSKLGIIGGSEFFFELFFSLGKIITKSSFISLIIISILIGILFSLIAYRTKKIKAITTKMGFFGTTGIFLGVLAPGCAACGIGLLSFFGLGAAVLTFLPFDGLEISILAILILGFSIFKITKDINNGIICKIDERR